MEQISVSAFYNVWKCSLTPGGAMWKVLISTDCHKFISFWYQISPANQKQFPEKRMEDTPPPAPLFVHRMQCLLNTLIHAWELIYTLKDGSQRASRTHCIKCEKSQGTYLKRKGVDGPGVWIRCLCCQVQMQLCNWNFTKRTKMGTVTKPQNTDFNQEALYLPSTTLNALFCKAINQYHVLVLMPKSRELSATDVKMAWTSETF